MSDCPKCPKCKSAASVYADAERNWWCNSCKYGFDDDPDEGGTHSNDPTRRIERMERTCEGKQKPWWGKDRRQRRRRRR